MLRLIEDPCINTAKTLLSRLQQDLYTAYTLFSLLDGVALDGAWVQTANDETVTALVVSTKKSTVYVSASAQADFEELRLFFRIFDGKTVYADPVSLHKLGIKPVSQLVFMELDAFPEADSNAVTVFDDFRPVYDLVMQPVSMETDVVPAIKQENMYKDWLSKTARGVFGGYTTVKAIYADSGLLLSAAMADVLGGFVYLRDVVTDRAFRRQGYGSACVRSICKDLKTENNTVFLLCDADKIEEFYKKSGFVRKAGLELGIVDI